MPTLDWRHYTILVALLACLTAWASREKYYRLTITEKMSQLERVTAEKRTAEQTALRLDQQIKTDTDTVEEATPIIMPDGSTAYVTRKTSHMVQSTVSLLQQDVKRLEQELSDSLTQTDESKKISEQEITKIGKRWYVGADIPTLAMQSPSLDAITAEVGVWVGPILLRVGNPVSARSSPRVGVGFSF